MSIPILFPKTDQYTPQKPRKSGPATHAPGYLVSHRGTLHFRIRVPTSLRRCLGCTEIRRSLGTSSLKEARPKVMKMAAVAHDIFNFVRKCLAMRDNQQEEAQKYGWQRFHPKALASLTDEQIREMAKTWLDQSLATEWEGWLLRDYSPRDPEEMRDILTSLYADRMYALEGRDYRSIEPAVDEVLIDGGVPQKAAEKTNMGTSVDVLDELARQAQLQYRKLCDAMLRASAALLDASSSPSFDGRLVPNPGLKISMARQVMEAWYSNDVPTPNPFKARPGHVTSVDQQSPPQAEVPSGPSLSAAVQDFLALPPLFLPQQMPPLVWPTMVGDGGCMWLQPSPWRTTTGPCLARPEGACTD